MAHKHTLVFEGEVPSDEMKRAAVLGHPAVQAARDALHAAFKEAGAEHTSESKLRRTAAPGAAKRGRRPAVAAAAE